MTNSHMQSQICFSILLLRVHGEQDDQYMDASIVCTGMDTFDTRPSQACKPCRTSCVLGQYVAGRCLRGNVSSPSLDTAYCVTCPACSKGEYLSNLCTGSAYADDKACLPCAFGSNGTKALASCPAGSFLVDECSSGSQLVDTSRCSTCKSNCQV